MIEFLMIVACRHEEQEIEVRNNNENVGINFLYYLRINPIERKTLYLRKYDLKKDFTDKITALFESDPRISLVNAAFG